MRLLRYLLPLAVGLLAGCADRMPATEARVAVHIAYMPTARRVVENVGRGSEAHKGDVSKAPEIDLRKVCRAVEHSDNPDQDRHPWCLRAERDAKAELQQRWSTFSAAERSACMPSSTGGVEESYVELLTCFEIVSALKNGPSTYRVRAQ